MFLKLLLSSSLKIIVAMAFLTDDPLIQISQEKLNNHLNYVLRQQYDIIITHIEKNILVSNCSIRIEIIRPISSIILYLHAKDIGITVFYYSRYYPTNSINEKTIIYKPVQSLYDNEMNIVEYIFASDLLPGYYIIKLVYNITEDTGLKNFYKRDERQWLAAYVDIGIQHMIPSLPKFSRTILPYKPIYNITVEHYQNYTVLSNVPIQKIEMNDKNTTKTHFNTLVKPNYFVFLTNRTNLFLIPGTNASIGVNMWCRMHCEFAHKFAENITSYLFDKWKRLNKIWQINHVAFPDFQNESIINLGLVLYRETDIIYNDNVDSVASKIKVARFIAHKAVQECFYYENPLWPLSSLSNEAIVAFLELYAINQALPNIRIIDLFVVQFQHESLHFDTEYNTSLYNTQFSTFNSSVENFRYIKVLNVLRILQHIITEEIFWHSIRIYTRIKNIKSTFDYFDEVMRSFLSIQMSTDDLLLIRRLIKSPTKQKYCPVVKIVRDYNYPIERIKASIQNINLNKSMEDYIPISYTTQTYHNFIDPLSNIILYHLLSPEFTFHFKNDGWIIFNIQQTGYYRVNYDIENWRRIASYLNSENYIKIHVLNRAQIIDDAFHLIITDQLNSTVFWNITKYLSRETDYVAWYPMFKALEYLSNIFLFSETNFENIKVIIRNLLQELLRNELGYDEVSNEDDLKKKSLRMEIANWACSLDEPICKERAGRNLRRHLADPEENTLLPWWKEWTYCQGLKTLSYSLSDEDSPWWGVYHLGKEKFKTKFLKYLACSEDPHFIKDYLNLIENNSATSIKFLKDFSDHDYINYFLFAIARHARNPVVLDFMLEKLKNIRPRQVSKYATFTIIINHVYSTKQLEKINDFLTDKLIDATKVELNEYRKIWIANTEKRDIKVKTSELNRITEEFRCMMQDILIIQSKIQIRFFEIKSQQNYFKNFV